jgi:hypothetical protein
MLLEQGVNRPPENSLSLAMDDPNLVDTFLKACMDVLIHHRGSVFRPESMKVQKAIDGKLKNIF